MFWVDRGREEVRIVRRKTRTATNRILTQLFCYKQEAAVFTFLVFYGFLGFSSFELISSETICLNSSLILSIFLSLD